MPVPPLSPDYVPYSPVDVSPPLSPHYMPLSDTESEPFEHIASPTNEAEADLEDSAEEDPSEDDPFEEDEPFSVQTPPTSLTLPALMTHRIPSYHRSGTLIGLRKMVRMPRILSLDIHASLNESIAAVPRKRYRRPPSPSLLPSPSLSSISPFVLPPHKRFKITFDEDTAEAVAEDTLPTLAVTPQDSLTEDTIETTIPGLVIGKTVEEIIPLLVVRHTRHDGVIDHARLTPVEEEVMTLRAMIVTLEQHDEISQDSLGIARDRISVLQFRAETAKHWITELLDL
ncbi:hypothetical protein Tco_0216032 [Tanacetum coccineum]